MKDGTNKMLIGACGIFCRACDHYFSNTEEGAHLLYISIALAVK